MNLSNLLGWSYFACWSLSYYPQVYDNWNRKSVRGVSVGFCVLNVYGALAYAIYTSYRYFMRPSESLVQLNDVMFALHSLLLTTISLSQLFVYRSSLPDPRALRLNLFEISYLSGTSLVALLWAALCMRMDALDITHLLTYISYIKLACSIIKWVPQIYLNCKNKSAEGLSIGYTILVLYWIFKFNTVGRFWWNTFYPSDNSRR